MMGPIFCDAQSAYLYAFKNNSKLNLKNEKVIATNIHYSYHYAKSILKSRFDLGEKIIAKDASYSYYYAKNILQGRFELGEPIIATNSDYCYLYAVDVLKNNLHLDFLQLCSIKILEYFLSDLENFNEEAKSNIIKVLFKKKLLGSE